MGLAELSGGLRHGTKTVTEQVDTGAFGAEAGYSPTGAQLYHFAPHGSTGTGGKSLGGNAFSAMISPVKRLLLILLLTILPLQYSWAAATVYCQHEQQHSTHFGHHSHQHPVQAGESNDQGKDAKKNVHGDCAFCQLAAQASFRASAPSLVAPEAVAHAALHIPRYLSHIPEGPKRPDWRLVA